MLLSNLFFYYSYNLAFKSSDYYSFNFCCRNYPIIFASDIVYNYNFTDLVFFGFDIIVDLDSGIDNTVSIDDLVCNRIVFYGTFSIFGRQRLSNAIEDGSKSFVIVG